MRKFAMMLMLGISVILAAPVAAQDNRNDRDFQRLFCVHHADRDPWYVGEATPLYQLAKACR